MLKDRWSIDIMAERRVALRIARQLEKRGFKLAFYDDIKPTKEPVLLVTNSNHEYWFRTEFSAIIGHIQNCTEKEVANEGRERYIFVSKIHRKALSKDWALGKKYWAWKMEILKRHGI